MYWKDVLVAVKCNFCCAKMLSIVGTPLYMFSLPSTVRHTAGKSLRGLKDLGRINFTPSLCCGVKSSSNLSSRSSPVLRAKTVGLSLRPIRFQASGGSIAVFRRDDICPQFSFATFQGSVHREYLSANASLRHGRNCSVRISDATKPTRSCVFKKLYDENATNTRHVCGILHRCSRSMR